MKNLDGYAEKCFDNDIFVPFETLAPPTPPALTDNTGVHSRNLRLAVLLALGLSVLADLLFWRQPAGWTLALFGIALGTALLTKSSGKFSDKIRLVKWPLMVLCISVLSVLLHGSAIGLFLGICALMALAVSAQSERMLSALQWIQTLFKFWFCAGLLLLDDLIDSMSGRSSRNPLWKSRMKSRMIAIGLAMIFLGLFARANPVLEGWFRQLGRWVCQVNIELVATGLLRSGRFLIVAIFILGYLCYRAVENQGDGVINEPPTLPVSVTDSCLIVFNLVFALQSILDIGCLFSGMSLPEGMTYAEYAHRGFYPLWLASMLAGGFMLLAWSDDPVKFPRSRRRNTLLFLWMAQNGLLLLSAIYRLNLYVCAYSLTRLRVAAFTGMILVLFGLVGIAVRSVRHKSVIWLLNLNGCAVLVVLLVLALSNVPARIAWFNVLHSSECSGSGTRLDVGYMDKLGEDALPALLSFVQNYPDSSGVYIARKSINSAAVKLRRDSENWRSWTINRYRIYGLVQALPQVEPVPQVESVPQRSQVFDRASYKLGVTKKRGKR